MEEQELLKITDSVHNAWNSNWRTLDVSKRTQIAGKIGELLLRDVDACAQLISDEMGKNLPEAVGEVKKCAMLCEYYKNHGASFIEPKSFPALPGMSKSYVVYQPLGTVLAIMPWNFPFWQVIRFAVPTMVAGNAVLMKHAPNVLGCAEKVEALIHEAMNEVLPGNSPEVSVYRNLRMSHEKTELLLSQSSVRGITLTGSTGAGKAVATLAGKYLKKCVVELGGADAYVVCADSNQDEAIKAIIGGRILNTGQSCIGPKRVLVDEAIEKEFVGKLTTAVSGLKYGENYSCLVHSRAKDDVKGKVEAAVAGGATCLVGDASGGACPDSAHSTDAYFNPVVLGNVKEDNIAFQGEIFGPVWSVSTFPAGDVKKAVQLHNGNEYGLGGGIFSSDVEKAEKIAVEELDTGMVAVNDFVRSDPSLPFGGAKCASGMGRECSYFGMHEFLNIKTVNVKAAL